MSTDLFTQIRSIIFLIYDPSCQAFPSSINNPNMISSPIMSNDCLIPMHTAQACTQNVHHSTYCITVLVFENNVEKNLSWKLHFRLVLYKNCTWQLYFLTKYDNTWYD
ncbi:hypothetical protein CHS0354_017690 [Potamilus streckersoni]|uniref:Uncharacterized protein n=1 Tax=Potamilus streckersoni TaxID=2493646 RepID=A0AAE0S7V4_9BIVA|nr:hypothetical protein CHS0354_017690 [Potamilus streckersoni]